MNGYEGKANFSVIEVDGFASVHVEMEGDTLAMLLGVAKLLHMISEKSGRTFDELIDIVDELEMKTQGHDGILVEMEGDGQCANNDG